jgi:hypothetical protein
MAGEGSHWLLRYRTFRFWTHLRYRNTIRFAGEPFYNWRKRLRRQAPMRFALVETGPAGRPSASPSDLELVLRTGERLRISSGVDSALLRTVLEALRA